LRGALSLSKMNRTLLGVGISFLLFSLSLNAQRTGIGVHHLALEIANDVLYLPLKTDRYFTSGLQLEYGYTRYLDQGHTTRYWRVNHNIYTPAAIDSVELQVGDRPFASYLVASHGIRNFNGTTGISLEQRWTAGALGRYAAGSQLQNAWHDMLVYADEVPGWHNEVKPDVILNYFLGFSRDYWLGERVTIRPLGEARLGTLNTDLKVGMEVEWKVLNFRDDRFLRMRFASDTRLVGYNATLSGGLFNRDDRYRGVVRPKTLVGSVRLEGEIVYNRLRLSGGWTYLSKEFAEGTKHLWGWFGIQRSF
ncbi:MAG: lipid A-modifier LpxR family protein, partial [Bacteroidota bacterium]